MSRPSKRPRIDDTATPDPEWTEGNFEVTTSDGVNFKVPDYLLFSASAVFRDARSAASLPAEQRIEFTDTDIETAPIFRFFLKVATTLEVRFGKAIGQPSCHLLPLLLFLRKWDCAPLLSLVLRSLEASITARQVLPLQAFRMAATLDATDVCAVVLRRRWPTHWGKTDPWWIDTSAGHYPFDPSGWSLRLWQNHTIPPEYLFALVQAVSTTLGVGGERLANRFETCLQDAKKALRQATHGSTG